MAKVALTVLLLAHGGIHLLGFVKGFGLAPVEQLKEPITRMQGGLWLASTVAFCASALALHFAPRAWWALAIPAIALSQALIVGAWADAKFGTVANVLVLVPALLAVLHALPSSLSSHYRRALVEERQAAAAPAKGVIAVDELAPLPAPVRAWLVKAGVVGKERPRGFVASLRGELKNGHDTPWMRATFTQQNTFAPASRVFFVEASMKGVPFEALHAYRGAHATMRVRVLGVKDIIHARGPEMDKSETVTMLNDLVLLAPAAVVDAPIVWEELDAQRARATFTNAGHTVSAVLTFRDDDLVGFVSDDRQQSADGVTFKSYPWSTPVRSHVTLNGIRVAREASAIWLEENGELEYARFTVDALESF